MEHISEIKIFALVFLSLRSFSILWRFPSGSPWEHSTTSCARAFPHHSDNNSAFSAYIINSLSPPPLYKISPFCVSPWILFLWNQRAPFEPMLGASMRRSTPEQPFLPSHMMAADPPPTNERLCFPLFVWRSVESGEYLFCGSQNLNGIVIKSNFDRAEHVFDGVFLALQRYARMLHCLYS